MEHVTAITHNDQTHRHLLCWKSALAGLALALAVFAALIGLSVAFGGIGLSDGTTFKRATTFTAVCVVLSTFLSIFAGAYYAVRVARFKVDLVGCAQGALVGALFLLIVLCQGMSAVGTMVKATGAAVGGAAVGATEAAQNPVVQDIIEDATGDLKLRSEPSTVAKGVASRLLRGDQESAKNYLAYQAQLTPEQADQRIQQAKAKVDEAMVKAREATATAMKASGWSVFVLIVLGFSAAVIGGLVATKANERYYLDMSDDEVQKMRVVRV